MSSVDELKTAFASLSVDEKSAFMARVLDGAAPIAPLLLDALYAVKPTARLAPSKSPYTQAAANALPEPGKDPQASTVLPAGTKQNFKEREGQLKQNMERICKATGMKVQYAVDFDGLYKQLEAKGKASAMQTLGAYCSYTWIEPVASTLETYLKDDLNKMNFNSMFHRQLLVVRVKPDDVKLRDGAGARLVFQDGALVVEVDIGPDIGCNLGQGINGTQIDNAIDQSLLPIDVALAAKSQDDPKYNRAFRMASRKSFRDNEKFRDQYMAAINKALEPPNGEKYTFECNYTQTYKDCVQPSHADRLGHMIYSETLGMVSRMLEAWGKDAFNRDAFNEQVSSRKIHFRLIDLKTPPRKSLTIEDKTLYLNCDPKEFTSGVRDVNNSTLDHCFDMYVDRSITKCGDPSLCKRFSLITRRDIRDHEKYHKEHLALISDALGGPHTYLIDWIAIHESQAHSQAKQEKLGWYMYQSWLGPIQRLLVGWGKMDGKDGQKEHNHKEWNRICTARTIELVTVGDDKQNETKCKFADGKCIVMTERWASFEGPNQFLQSTLDKALDLHKCTFSTQDGKTPVPGTTDPKLNLFFPHTIRKAFQEKEKFLHQHLERATKATGGKAWTLECDWVKTWQTFEEAKSSHTAANSVEFAYRHYYGYSEGLANICESKVAGAQAKLNEKIPTHVMVLRPKVHDPWLSSNTNTYYQFEDGKLIVEYHPRDFGQNLHRGMTFGELHI